MVEISKHLFDAACANVHCSVLTHPWHEDCFKSLTTAYKDSFIGSAKFYFIIHLIQNLIKGKKILNKKELMKAGEYYVRSAVMGGLICGTISPLVCVLRWIMGRRYNYYNFILIPSLLNGVFILLEPPKRRSLVINLFCSLLIEYWLRTLQRAGYISLTVTKQTLLFMIGSSLLFYLMRLEGDKEKRTSVLWLFTPEKVRRKTDDSDDICPHRGPCLKYVLKGAITYFGIGFGINVARLLLPNILRPWKALSSVRSHHFNLGLFFGTYTGIYRAVICYLCRKEGCDAAEYALPAGFLAGLSFIFKPSLGFAIASLTGAFKLYSTILYDKKILTDRINLPVITYCICQGILFHARVMHSEVCPQYMFKLMSAVSNGRSEQVCANITKVVTDQLAKQNV